MKIIAKSGQVYASVGAKREEASLYISIAPDVITEQLPRGGSLIVFGAEDLYDLAHALRAIADQILESAPPATPVLVTS